MAIKNKIFIEVNFINISAKFQVHPPYGFWGEDFWIFFLQIYPLGCHDNRSNSAVWTKFIRFIEDYSRNISVKLLSKYLQWESNKANFHFSHYKSMETISCHSYQSSYSIGTTKLNYLFPLPIDAILNMESISFTASEEMLFEKVDRRLTTTNGQWTMEAYLYYKLTSQPSVHVS